MPVSSLRLRPRAWAGLALLFGAALAPPAAGQDRVILRNGQKFEGRVVGEEGNDLRIVVDYGEIRVRRALVVRIEPVGAKPATGGEFRVDAATTRPGEGPAMPRRPSPRRAPAGAPPESMPAAEGAGAPAHAESVPKPLVHAAAAGREDDSFDERVEGALARFLWFIPASGFRIGFGAALVIVTTLLTLFSCRMADVENRTLGRSLLFSVSLLSILALAVHFATFSPVGLALLVVVTLVAWFCLARGILGAGAYRGTVLLACFTFSVLLAVMWIEVLGLAFRPGTA